MKQNPNRESKTKSLGITFDRRKLTYSYQLQALVLESQDRDQPQQVQTHMDYQDVHAWNT